VRRARDKTLTARHRLAHQEATGRRQRHTFAIL
jgi:hypothetical protein